MFRKVLMHHNEMRGSSARLLNGNNSATWLIVRHVDDYCPSLATYFSRVSYANCYEICN